MGESDKPVPEAAEGIDSPKPVQVAEQPQAQAEPPKPINFAEFLESIGPSQAISVVDLWAKYDVSMSSGTQRQILLRSPQLLLHCTSDTCNGHRIFRYNSGDIRFKDDDEKSKSIFVTYCCSNCRRTFKTYSLSVVRGAGGGGRAYKYGEEPPFGPQTPSRLLRLFGNDRDIFLKGRQCEIHGLGIGAFVYYRLVVENHKNQIMDEIITVAQKVGASPEMVKAIENAKAEIQFSKGVKRVKVAIPQSLLSDGHNPLTLLHSALSCGVHELTDEECLQLAHDVRIVLVDLAERINQALSDQAELKSAVSRLSDSNGDANG